MSLQQRKDEILAKRAKLAELKRTRELREREKSQRESLTPGSAEAGRSSPSRAEARKELDDLISSLVDKPHSGRSSRGASPAAKASRPSSIGGTTALSSEGVDAGPETPIKEKSAYTTSQATQTLAEGEVSTAYEVAPAPRPTVTTYSVGVQTTETWSPQHDEFSDDELGRVSSPTLSPRKQKRLSRIEQEREDELRANLRKEIEEELKALKDPTQADLSEDAVQRFPARALTDEETNAVTSSEEFLDFVDRSSKVIERALDQEYDVLADYALDGLDEYDEDEDEGYASSRGRKGRRLKEVAQFYDERWCKKRMISDINFSPKFPELLLTSYTKNPSAPQDPSGLLQVWNLHLHSRPEYTFHSTSDILTAKFSPFHPSLIVGGCYSGQVALWDTRSRSPLPVQKTRLTGASSSGHTHPVYCVDVVGTQNANNVISCSTDGLFCAWSVDMLAQPQESLELKNPSPHKTDEMAPTSIGFPPSDPTSFLIGTEEGTIYPCHRYDRAGARAGVGADIRYKGHTAPVMGLNFHSARGPVDLSDLVLTSSLDWSVKLWRVRPFSSSSRVTGTTTSKYSADYDASTEDIPCVAEFAREDVVYDARWAPQRPGVFALVDGAGSVEVWDILVDTEIPVAKAAPSSQRNAAGFTGYGLKSLNKVSWDEKDGKRLAVGGAAGVVTAYEVGSELAGEGVKAEDWANVKRLVGKMERGVR